MSIFNFIRNQLIDIVEWNQGEDAGDVMAWRFPRHENEIKNGAKLIVREGQMALFVNMGQLADVFGPGMYSLETKNLPILSTLMGWKYGFNSPFKCEVYFISTRRFMELKWGTANPVTMRDQDFGMVRVRAYGGYAIQVTDGAKFLRQVLSTDPRFETYGIAGQLRQLIVTRFSNVLAASGIPVLDMAANLDDLSRFVSGKLEADFGEMGISVPIFLVENISLPPNVEKALDKRTSMGVLGNLDQYMKFQAAEALEKAAENPSGGAAGVGVGLGAGVAMGNQMMGAMQPGGMAAGAAAAPAMAPPPLPGQRAEWFLAIGGQSTGPVALDEVFRRIRNREIARDTLVWKEGMTNWTPAGDMPEISSQFGSMPPPLPPPGAPS